MTRQECFKILQVEPSAGPSTIKQAYRKLAFELHPDLNPGLPEASKRFQQLNEAYVLLMQEYANTSYGARSKTADHSGTTGHADAKAREDARKAYEKAKSRFGTGAGAGTDAAGPSGAAQAGEAQSGAPNEERAKNASNQYRKASREEILQDLLNDPFARRVFEDIYSHVRHGQNQAAGSGKKSAPGKNPVKKKKIPAKPARRPMLVSAGTKMAGVAGSLAGGMRSWFRKQIDDEQIMYLPGESLYPGARVRLQVRHGFSESSRTIEFTLPPEFQPGRPIRLKGLGKHLGSIKGDLYLRVYSKDDEEE